MGKGHSCHGAGSLLSMRSWPRGTHDTGTLDKEKKAISCPTLPPSILDRPKLVIAVKAQADFLVLHQKTKNQGSTGVTGAKVARRAGLCRKLAHCEGES